MRTGISHIEGIASFIEITRRQIMANTKGKSIRFFMVDGTPQGILTLEIVNWTGHVLSGPRTKIAELIQRPEMKKTGVYFLTGPDPDGSYRPCVYIGESDNVGNRLIQHNKDETKDFWERACIITSKDQNLTKAHGRYLESRLIAIALEAGHAKLFNSTAPKNEGLPEADIADMEYFISQIRLTLPVLGLEFLREKPQVRRLDNTFVQHVNFEKTENPEQSISENQTDSPRFELNRKKDGIHAIAKEIIGDFVVFSGSETVDQWKGIPHNYQKHFDSLVSEGKIKIDKNINKGIFQEDVPFSSPSAAAAIILGRAANGRTEWKIFGTNKTYEQWQNEIINETSVKRKIN